MNMSDQPEQWQRFEVDGIDIEFVEHGSGAPIFLVHAGVFGGWFRLVGESDALRGFRVVRLRRAGYGPSQPERHLTLTDHARHAAALAEWLCPKEQIHWVGHSSSCQIGLALAIERPMLVSSLVLLEPAAAGGFQVPASAVLGPFIGGAMAAVSCGASVGRTIGRSSSSTLARWASGTRFVSRPTSSVTKSGPLSSFNSVRRRPRKFGSRYFALRAVHNQRT